MFDEKRWDKSERKRKRRKGKSQGEMAMGLTRNSSQQTSYVARHGQGPISREIVWHSVA